MKCIYAFLTIEKYSLLTTNTHHEKNRTDMIFPKCFTQLMEKLLMINGKLPSMEF